MPSNPSARIGAAVVVAAINDVGTTVNTDEGAAANAVVGTTDKTARGVIEVAGEGVGDGAVDGVGGRVVDGVGGRVVDGVGDVVGEEGATDDLGPSDDGGGTVTAEAPDAANRQSTIDGKRAIDRQSTVGTGLTA